MEENKKIVLRLKKGDRLAFTMIYMKYHQLMYGFSYKYLYDRFQAEDAVQWLFIKLWENRELLNEELNIKSYLFTSLKNHLLNVLRDQARGALHQELYAAECDTEDDGWDEQLNEEEMRLLLEKAISHLSPQKRRICELKIREELSNAEIAERLHISVNTVKFQYNQIIKDLRSDLLTTGKNNISINNLGEIISLLLFFFP